MKNFRLATIIGLTALTAGGALSAQTPAEDAADAAVVVAADAENAIRAIDPTTGGDSLVVDPSLPQPYGFEAEVAEDIEALPELPPANSSLDFDEVTYNSIGTTLAPSAPAVVEAPRGPAARMISQPQVQALPVPGPTPAPISAPAPALAQTSDDPFTIKSILPIEGSIRYGEWYWDESRAPATGKLVVTVDLDARVISVFRDGHEIGTAVALVGTARHPTPLGTFPILTKERDNVSEKYNDAPMPWTLRLTWDGIAIHGSPVMNGYASHGCIGVPDPFAEKLFAIAARGDKVVITRGQYIGIGDKIMS